ncbi:TadE/TadG family type IV pilus assembly protein [Pigmentiphaga humi]|nr:TadE family protein [Pigmentiphaga humi]
MTHPRSRPAAGAAMVEFTIIALPLLFLACAAFETGRWMLARQAVGYALFETARVGTVAGADPAAMAEAFERALAPALGVDGQADPGALAEAVGKKMQAWADAHGMPMARIEQLNPIPASFDDFPDVPARTGQARQLDHDHLRLRHDTVYLSRYRNGVGPRSGQTVFQANTLVLRLTYLHAPYWPVMRALLRQLAGADERDAYVRRAREAGLVVIRKDIAMPMQSAAREHGHAADLLAARSKVGKARLSAVPAR